MSPCLEFRTKKDKNKLQRWSIRVGTSPDPNSFGEDYLLLKRYYCFKIIPILLHIIIIVIISPFLLNRNSLYKCLVMILSKAFLLSHKIKIYPIHKNTDAHLSIGIIISILFLLFTNWRDPLSYPQPLRSRAFLCPR